MSGYGRKSHFMWSKAVQPDNPLSAKGMAALAHETMTLARMQANIRHTWGFTTDYNMPTALISDSEESFEIPRTGLWAVPFLVGHLNAGIDADIYYFVPNPYAIRVRLVAYELVAAFSTVEGPWASGPSTNMPTYAVPAMQMNIRKVAVPYGNMHCTRASINIASPPADRRILLGVDCIADRPLSTSAEIEAHLFAVCAFSRIKASDNEV